MQFKTLFNPFVWPYAFVIWVRNKLYDYGIFKVNEIPIASICVGNLSLGGTGKSPLTNWLIDWKKNEMQVQVLSRGYGRISKGARLFQSSENAETFGDEPFMYALKHGINIDLAVAEKRWDGWKILPQKDNRILILDDAFQHRAVKAKCNIVVTTFQKPFFEDNLLPFGRLRELPFALKRADLVLVSKCPETIQESEKQIFTSNIHRFKNIPVFFGRYRYEAPISFDKAKTWNAENVLLVTGIAQPKPIEIYLKAKFKVETIKFPDHHNFTASEIQAIHRKFDTFADCDKAILTTEKDFARLWHKREEWGMKDFPWFYLPIALEIENEIEFKNLVNSKL